MAGDVACEKLWQECRYRWPQSKRSKLCPVVNSTGELVKTLGYSGKRGEVAESAELEAAAEGSRRGEETHAAVLEATSSSESASGPSYRAALERLEIFVAVAVDLFERRARQCGVRVRREFC